MKKFCPMCRQDLPLDAFYRRRQKEGVTVYCKRCSIEQTVTRQRKLKSQAIAYKGARCQQCGYDACEGALEFHHRDPNEKDFSLSRVGTTDFEKVKDELNKCDLLCANCHREIHAQLPRRTTARQPIENEAKRKRCPSCNEHLPLNAFYSRRTQPGACSYCKRCAYETAIRRQRRLKQQAVAYKGSHCQRCGYDRCIGALEFHHRDPGQKDFSFSHVKQKNFEHVKCELDKCDLLCVNCHREVHARMTGLNQEPARLDSNQRPTA